MDLLDQNLTKQIKYETVELACSLENVLVFLAKIAP